VIRYQYGEMSKRLHESSVDVKLSRVHDVFCSSNSPCELRTEVIMSIRFSMLFIKADGKEKNSKKKKKKG
jgi:hypothetical protein